MNISPLEIEKAPVQAHAADRGLLLSKDSRIFGGGVMHTRCADCCPAVLMYIDSNERARRVDELLRKARMLRALLDGELVRARQLRRAVEMGATFAARPPAVPWEGERDGPK